MKHKSLGKLKIKTVPHRPQLSPRLWLGIKLDPKRTEVFVRGTICHSPAARSRLRAGDQITRIGSRPVVRKSEIQEIVANLKVWKRTTISVRRGTKHLRLSIKPALNLYSKSDQLVSSVDDRRCDDDCECLRPRKDTACATSSIYKGVSANGCVMYLFKCVSMTKDYVELDDHECGPYECI